jgi:hypothetical protein
MIDPKLADWWSWKRLTELSFKDSSLSGAGISLQVIRHALQGMGLIWYSKVYGEFDDDLVLLGFEKTIGAIFEQAEYETVSPARANYGDLLPDEYVMTAEIFSDLGINLENNYFTIDREDKIAYQVYIHDNCFFCIKPASEILISQMLHNILQQHSFYLRQEVDWSGVMGKIQAELIVRGKIELQSDPRRTCLWIKQLENRSPVCRLIGPGTVPIKAGVAYFRV